MQGQEIKRQGIRNKGVSAMKTEKKEKTVARRDFLRVLGLGAGAAVTAAGPLVQEAAADSEPNNDKRRSRYKADSPDVQAYYRVNRYPAKK
jgi:hypothetical protein